MSGWQLIETAPKDKPILAWLTEDELYSEAQPWAVVWWHGGGWAREGDDYNLAVEPTHWMPLPEPPKSSTT